MEDGFTKRFRKALHYLRNKRFAKAITSLHKIIYSGKEIYSIMPEESFRINEFDYLEELTRCEKELKNNEDSLEAYYALSLVFKLADNHERRKFYLKKAIEKNNSNATLWREYGETLFLQGDVNNALGKFQEALNIDPNDVISLEGRALCYYYLDQPTKAVMPLKKALTLQPNNHQIMNRLAFIYSEIGELDQAMELIQKAIALDRDNNVYLDTYACILFLQEKYHEALKTFEKLLERNVKDYEISWDILTTLYDTLGMHGRAKIIENKLPMD
jgi:tetratricopeptide (TPR) repeat protein